MQGLPVTQAEVSDVLDLLSATYRALSSRLQAMEQWMKSSGPRESVERARADAIYLDYASVCAHAELASRSAGDLVSRITDLLHSDDR